MSRRTLKVLLLSVSALILLAWGVYLIVLLTDRYDRKDAAEVPSNEDVPEGSVQIWRLTKEYELTEDGKDGEIIFLGNYDDAGRCISAEHYTYGGQGKETEKIRYEYDAETHCVTETIRSDTMEVRQVVNPRGGMKEVGYQSVERSGNLSAGRWQALNENDRITESYFYDIEGQPYGRTIYSYDAYGNTINRKTHDESTGQEQVLTRAEFDKKGRTLRVFEIDSESRQEVLTREIEYAGDGARTERVYSMYYESKEPIIRVYNAKGELVTETWWVESDHNPCFEKKEMEYEDGQLVKQIEYNDDIPVTAKEIRREKGDHRYTVTTTEQRFFEAEAGMQIVTIETWLLHGDSSLEDERYDSWETRTIVREKDGTASSEKIDRYEFTYDESDRLVSFRLTETNGGETRYRFGGRYVYEPMIVTKEQAKDNEEYFDQFYRQVMNERTYRDESWGWD